MDIYVIAKLGNKFASPQKFCICLNKVIEDPVDLTRMAEKNYQLKAKNSKVHWLKRRIHDFYGEDYPEWTKNIKNHALVECEVDSEDSLKEKVEWIPAISAVECLGKSKIESVWLGMVDDDE